MVAVGIDKRPIKVSDEAVYRGLFAVTFFRLGEAP